MKYFCPCSGRSFVQHWVEEVMTLARVWRSEIDAQECSSILANDQAENFYGEELLDQQKWSPITFMMDQLRNKGVKIHWSWLSIP